MHNHKNFTQSESRRILSENYIYEGSGRWRRKTAQEIEEEIRKEVVPAINPKPNGMFSRILKWWMK